MERKRILELAVEALEKQKADVDAEMASIRAELGWTTESPAAGIERTRTTAGRKSQSQRMKEYWAARKAKEGKPAAASTKAAQKPNARSLAMKEAWKRRSR